MTNRKGDAVTDSTQSVVERQAVALDLARKATQLQCAVAGYTNVRETDTPPTPEQLCGQIIEKAEALR